MSNALTQMLQDFAYHRLIDAVLKATFPIELHAVCRVLRCKGDMLLLACYSAHWFRQVHAFKDLLLSKLQKTKQLSSIKQIQIRVFPDDRAYLTFWKKATQHKRTKWSRRRNQIQFLKLQRLLRQTSRSG